MSKPKASTENNLNIDKNSRVEPEICFYIVEGGDEAEEGGEAEILVKSDLRREATKQKKIKALPINTIFDHQGPIVVNNMRKLTVEIFDRLGIIFWKDVDASIRYT